MRMNPGELKLELLCKGIRLDTSVTKENIRKILRTRGGLGSGLEIILPDDLWVNAPVVEDFAKSSPYKLVKDGNFYITKNGEEVAKVNIPRNPEFYTKKTSDGTEMIKIGIMQGGYLAFYLGPKCGYWEKGLNCRFCSSGLNVGRTENERKTVEQVVEVTKEAFNEGIADFIHINMGFIPDESRGLKLLGPYVRALKKEINTLIAIQTNPPKTNEWIDYAYSIGVDSMSFDFEIFDKEIFAKICPGKAKLIGQERFFEAMEYAGNVFPNGATAGEIIAGLEPVESTIAGIDYITSVGALPIVCVFRPLKHTYLERESPPNPKDICSVFAHMYEACKKNRIRMCLVDKVPLVIMPFEGRYFSQQRVSLGDRIANTFFKTKFGKKIFCKAGDVRRGRKTQKK
jgi:hypothetical protein